MRNPGSVRSAPFPPQDCATTNEAKQELLVVLWYGWICGRVWVRLILNHTFTVSGSFGLATGVLVRPDSLKYKPWLDRARVICHRIAPKRHDHKERANDYE